MASRNITEKQDDEDVLMPKTITVKVGGKTYEQAPLTLLGTSNLISIVSGEIQTIMASPYLASVLNTDIDTENSAKYLPVLIQVIASIPNALPRIICVFLTGDTDEEEVDYINRHCGLLQATKMLKVAVEQNEIKELIANFTALRDVVAEGLSQATTEPTV